MGEESMKSGAQPLLDEALRRTVEVLEGTSPDGGAVDLCTGEPRAEGAPVVAGPTREEWGRLRFALVLTTLSGLVAAICAAVFAHVDELVDRRVSEIRRREEREHDPDARAPGLSWLASEPVEELPVVERSAGHPLVRERGFPVGEGVAAAMAAPSDAAIEAAILGVLDGHRRRREAAPSTRLLLLQVRRALLTSPELPRPHFCAALDRLAVRGLVKTDVAGSDCATWWMGGAAVVPSSPEPFHDRIGEALEERVAALGRVRQLEARLLEMSRLERAVGQLVEARARGHALASRVSPAASIAIMVAHLAPAAELVEQAYGALLAARSRS